MTLTLINCRVYVCLDGEASLGDAGFKVHLQSKWEENRLDSSEPHQFRIRSMTPVTHNAGNDRGDVVKIIRETDADVTKELNGPRQLTHRVPDANCTTHRLTHTHRDTHIRTILQMYFLSVCCSNLVEILPVCHFSVRKCHPAQKSLTHTNTQIVRWRHVHTCS